MRRTSQIYYTSGPSNQPGGWLGRIIAFVVGVIVLAVSVFLGAVFIAGAIGLILIGGVIFALRVWWLRRKMEQYQREHGDLDAEYTEAFEERRSIDQD